jgi:hypothetical protein
MNLDIVSQDQISRSTYCTAVSWPNKVLAASSHRIVTNYGEFKSHPM